jgi:putative serine protease PepD
MNETPRGADDRIGPDHEHDADATTPAPTTGGPVEEARVGQPGDGHRPEGTPRPDERAVTFGAPPLPGSTPGSLADEAAARSGAADGRPAPQQPGSSQAPGAYQSSGAYQAPGSAHQPGPAPHQGAWSQQAPYQQPGAHQQSGAYGQQSGAYGQQSGPYGQPQQQQPSSTQQPSSYAQPTSTQQPSSYAQPTSYPQSSSHQPTDAFGRPAAGGAPQGAPAWAPPTSTTTKRRGGKGVLAAALAVGLIAGGALGGVVGGVVADGRGTTTASSGPSRELTVNDYDDATAITAVAAKATPSVVTINVASGSSGGTGSGVIVSDDGYIVTNTHVVTLDGASASGTVTVTLSDGNILPAEVVGLDPTVDLAVLKVDATGLKPITFADSSDLNVGDTAVAIGAPLGLSNTVTDGIVSTLNRSITVQSSAAPSDGTDQGDQGDNNGQGPFSFNNGDGSTQNQASSVISLPVIQTDASINPGNSGGALLDAKGDLIGLNVAIASSGSSSGSIGVGFSIPSALVERVSKEIIADGSATHGLLGASVDDAATAQGADRVGALIVEISQGGAAQEAGLRAGDVVTEFNGIAVTSRTDLTAQVRFLAGGATADLTYVRDGKEATASVTLDTLTS